MGYQVDVSEGCRKEERRVGRGGRRVRGKGPRAGEHSLRHKVGGGVTRGLVIVVVAGQLVTDARPRRRPMVHWSASCSIPSVSECIQVVFEAPTESSQGECQRREVYAGGKDHGSIKSPIEY